MNSQFHIGLDETFKKLNNRNVKDLYWLLFSHCPINNNHPALKDIPFFPEEIILDWKMNSANYFLELDQRPEVLSHFLDRPKNKRLGFYAEALLSFFFQTFSQVELLLQNFQIIDDKRTLGEVDFIIKWNDRVIHIECAVKFYLCNHSKEVNDLHSWIGPACKDDLGRKIDKVKDQQLPMINNSKLKGELSSNEIESYLFLKGKLFVNQEISCDWISNELLGKYNYLDEIDIDDGLNLLKKPFWMSGMSEKASSSHSIRFEEGVLKNRAELVMKTGFNPFFVVPKKWPI